ncbi:unnamed protein product [Victoria cruziana]
MDLGAPENRLAAFDRLGNDAIDEIAQSWKGFCACLDVLLSGCGNPSLESEFTTYINVLSRHGFALLIQEYILQAVENVDTFFWLVFLHGYFKRRLEVLVTMMTDDDQDSSTMDIGFSTDKQFGSKSRGVDEMDVDESNETATRSSKNRLVRTIGKVVTNLRSLGFASMTEDAYASAIFLLLKHSKLIDSFISALRYRLLTAGASTNDILHQYISTIKALCKIDPTGVFLEAVSEPIRDYLRGRKDTIKCIVNMLTDGTGGGTSGSGGAGDSLLEELNRNVDNLEISDHDNDFNSDDKQAWADAQSWEPDPIEADPLKGGRNGRKVDILGMLVGIIGSKDQLVNQYHIMLAEKLLNKLDFDIDSEIRTLELLKIHFGESSMQKCEIMLNDLRHSKRTNSNIKDDLAQSSQKGTRELENEVSMDLFDATIISTKFWPPFQVELESLYLPGSIDQLFKDYAQRFHELKTPRKLNWMKNLGVVKLELEFEDRSLEFKVSPLCAVIILKFQEQTSWTSRKLSDSIGVPVDVLNRAIGFWISKGLIAESLGTENNDHILTLIEDVGDANKNSVSTARFGGLLAVEEEGESSMSMVEEQVKKEMTVYEKYVFGMLTNFGSMTLDRIHNTLKMFCMGDHPYDKSIHQLQNFLSGLVSEEKLELRDGAYLLKK